MAFFLRHMGRGCPHEQLLTLLNPIELQELRVREAFNPFNAVQPLTVTEAVAAPWAKAVRDYERRLEPIEHRVAMKLRYSLAAVAAQP